MKYTYQQFNAVILDLPWDEVTLADKLSAIGHETVVENGQLDVTLTANRKDCRNFDYLIYDLAGVYGLSTRLTQVRFSHQPAVAVTVDQINHLLGTDLRHEDIRPLERLGFAVSMESIAAPVFREPMTTVAEIAEEVLRVVGIQRAKIVPLSRIAAVYSAEYSRRLAIARLLTELGFFETKTQSFTGTGSIELQNPFTQTEPFLRASLLPGLLQTAARNPFMKRVCTFEIGSVFSPEETVMLGILVTGSKKTDELSQQLSSSLGVAITLNEVPRPEIERYAVKQARPYWVEIPLPTLTSAEKEIPLTLAKYRPISKYPPLVRDYTVTIDEEGMRKIQQIVAQKFGNALLFSEIIDRYTPADNDKPSLTTRFIIQSFDTSFTEQEIARITEELDGVIEGFQSGRE